MRDARAKLLLLWCSRCRRRRRILRSLAPKSATAARTSLYEKAFAFFKTLPRLFKSAENVRCRQISLELISWGPHSSLEKERKIRCRRFMSP